MTVVVTLALVTYLLYVIVVESTDVPTVTIIYVSYDFCLVLGIAIWLVSKVNCCRVQVFG